MCLLSVKKVRCCHVNKLVIQILVVSFALLIRKNTEKKTLVKSPTFITIETELARKKESLHDVEMNG